MKGNIRITVLAIKKPGIITTDCYNKEFKRKSNVAFNFAGSIRKGVLQHFTCVWVKGRDGPDKKTWWNVKFSAEVLNDSNTISHIKNPNSLIILE
jgi:hypothetical protein